MKTTKTIIQKTIHNNEYKVNGKLVRYNERTNSWKTYENLSITEMFNFQQFLKHGQLSREQLACKLNKLELEKRQLVEKITSMLKQNKPAQMIMLYEVKLAKIIEQLADYKYNVIVYQN